jgi:hypothetical protein
LDLRPAVDERLKATFEFEAFECAGDSGVVSQNFTENIAEVWALYNDGVKFERLLGVEVGWETGQ